MTDLQKVILIALGLMLVLCLIVSMTLRHYIGGFLENVAREEEEAEKEDERGRAPDVSQEKER